MKAGARPREESRDQQEIDTGDNILKLTEPSSPVVALCAAERANGRSMREADTSTREIKPQISFIDLGVRESHYTSNGRRVFRRALVARVFARYLEISIKKKNRLSPFPRQIFLSLRVLYSHFFTFINHVHFHAYILYNFPVSCRFMCQCNEQQFSPSRVTYRLVALKNVNRSANRPSVGI